MKCIILAAGKGTRLKPLTDHTPKPLLPIKGRPLLEYTLENLPDEVDDVIIVVKHLGHLIKEHFGKKWAGKKLTYLNAVGLRGTADMIRQAKRFVKGKTLVICGDDIYKKSDLARLLVEVPESEWGILVAERDDASNFGVLSLNTRGTVAAVIEKPEHPASNLVNAGAYLFDERIFKYRPVKLASGEYGLPQTMAQAKEKIIIRAVRALFWQPISTLQDYEKAKNG